MVAFFVLVATCAVFLLEGTQAKYVDLHEVQENVYGIKEQKAERVVEGKGMETKEQVQQMIAEKGLLRSVFGQLWELIKDVVTTPFKFLMRVADFILLVPRLVVESFRQWRHKKD